MPETLLTLRQDYADSLRAFLAEDGEALRERAFGLGRRALELGLGILDLAQMHQAFSVHLGPGEAQARAAEFLAEALAPFEMRLRGAQEANARLLADNVALEARVAERTRGLREREAQLHQAMKMEAIGRLAGGLAHDFNNLLTVICGSLELSLEGALPDRTAEDLRIARKAADQAAKLTRELLGFSRRQHAEPRILDLNQELAEALPVLARLAGPAVSLSLEPAEPPCRTWADPGHLSQVLMNLVSNARDAMPEGGKVVLSAGAAELAEGHLHGHPLARPGRYAVVAVRDTGQGMDAATQARVFEPFFSTKSLGKGTGLGLATVYSLVEQAGGIVTVHSAPGQGSTFKVYLPMAPEAQVPAAANGARQRPEGSR